MDVNIWKRDHTDVKKAINYAQQMRHMADESHIQQIIIVSREICCWWNDNRNYAMKSIYSFIIFIIIMPVATAAPGLFDILNKTAYNGSLDIVTDYKDPDKTVQAHKHIRGWINITGFNNTVRINGTEYSNIPEPRVEFEVWDEGLIWDDNLDWIHTSETKIIQEGNKTKAEIDIHLLWHRSTLKSRTVNGRTHTWIQKDYTDEYATLSSYVRTPQQYPALDDIPVRITIYNNTLNPHVDIHTPIQPFTVKTEFTYKNETITRFTLAGAASTGAVNLSECLYWHDDVNNISSRNSIAILKYTNESDFNISDLIVTAYTPYESKILTNYSISTVELDTVESIVEKGIITHIISMLIFGWGIKKCMSVWGDLI